MNTTATRARTLLALGTLTAATAAVWGISLTAPLSPRADRTILAAAVACIFCTATGWGTFALIIAVQRLAREAWDRDESTRMAVTALADISRKPGDGTGPLAVLREIA